MTNFTKLQLLIEFLCIWINNLKFLEGRNSDIIFISKTHFRPLESADQDGDINPPSLNPLTPNDHYSGRTAPLTSKCCILYMYSANTGTEYFKHGIYSPFFFSSKCSLFHNSNIFGSCFIHILYTECAEI